MMTSNLKCRYGKMKVLCLQIRYAFNVCFHSSIFFTVKMYELHKKFDKNMEIQKWHDDFKYET